MAGDDDLEDLYRHHRGSMVRLAFLLTGSQAIAEELVQDAFVQMWGRGSVERPVAYLRQVVVNLTRRHHRRGARTVGQARRGSSS